MIAGSSRAARALIAGDIFASVTHGLGGVYSFVQAMTSR
jgi:hypothetical protein